MLMKPAIPVTAGYPRRLPFLSGMLAGVLVTAMVMVSAVFAQPLQNGDVSGGPGNNTRDANNTGSGPPGGDRTEYFLEGPESTKHALILTGPGAGEAIERRFRQWSLSLHDTLARDYGYSSERIILLLSDGRTGQDNGGRIDGASRQEVIRQAVSELAERAGDGDQVTVFLIGHGTPAPRQTPEQAKFNIPGPDITGEEFAAVLSELQRQQLVIINTTSASYGFSQALADEGRIVVSATRSQAEKYDTVFAGQLIEGLQDRVADRDKNGRVSILEAFNYARRNVADWYDQQERLAHEHAVLDDSGDGRFSGEPAPAAGDGGLAELAYIDVPGLDDEKRSPEARELRVRMQELERAIFVLRGQKADYLEDNYWQRLEELLIELAITTGEYDELP